MKNCTYLILLCFVLLTGCQSYYSFRVNEDTFSNGGESIPGNFDELPDAGVFNGLPTGDEYQTTGLVTRTEDGEIRLSGEEKSSMYFIGRDLQASESPTSAIVKFGGRSNGLSGSSIEVATFTIYDEQGDEGLTFTIDGHGIFLSSGEGITELSNPNSVPADFNPNVEYNIFIQLNFQTKQGLFTLEQFNLEESLDFTLPAAFGRFRVLESGVEMQNVVGSSSPFIYSIVKPTAVFLDAVELYSTYAYSYDRKTQACSTYHCTASHSGGEDCVVGTDIVRDAKNCFASCNAKKEPEYIGERSSIRVAEHLAVECLLDSDECKMKSEELKYCIDSPFIQMETIKSIPR